MRSGAFSALCTNTKKFAAMFSEQRQQKRITFIQKRSIGLLLEISGVMVLYALCGISQVGKTTILKHLLQREPLLTRLVTTTTRPPRPEEENHVDYHFVTVQQFQTAVGKDEIVYPILYRGEWYGTARVDLAACASKEAVAVLRPDKMNTLQEFFPLVGIYISRPDHDQIVSPDDQIIIDHQHLCCYQVVNVPGKLDQTVDQILRIIHAHIGG